MKKLMSRLVVIVLLFSLSFATYAHKYSNSKYYQWMVSDCSKVVKSIMMKGYTVQIEQVYTAMSNDKRLFYYVFKCSKWGAPTQYFHTYVSKQDSNGRIITAKSYESLGYEYGDLDEDVQIKMVMNQMKQKKLCIDTEALIHLRVECVK